MRNSVRIDNFLSKVDIRDLLLNIWKVCDNDIDSVEKSILNDILDIKDEWLFSTNLRFSQLLVNLGYVPNIPGGWYYLEEDEILRMQGYKPRDYTFWGSIYNSDGELLEETKYNLIKDLEISHMKKLVEGNWLRNFDIKKVITDELKMRTRIDKLNKINSL